ncbi:malto-oligosyltrehalose trehalohydrolase [Dyadobacter tibetensis]|uniref:malto-oligosyltrehalose trehalohydrolase n=1 Tax=Dyadobacter tibetensis TaxID=1211851 RepID=UPI0004BA45BB|nr:malto-oligosyltrehalose trehalohydrolase [Dyadobacter tibetensis]
MEKYALNREAEPQKTGVTFNEKGLAQVQVWAPLASLVEICLHKNQVRLALNQLQDGYWGIETDALSPGDYYKFSLDGTPLLPDPCSRAQPEGVHGPSQAIRLDDFCWTDSNWKNIPLSEYVIYELHVGTFSDQGTFEGVLNRLDYLVDLGVTAIEIMPVAQFPGKRNWGYDGVFPFAVQNSYGGARGLQQLINACHRKGLAVILDVVYNHMGPEGNYLSSYGPYFTDKYHTPWGSAVNFDDAYCDGVRRFVLENARMWFEDFHIDALRLDAVHAIKDFSPKHILQELKEQTVEIMQKSGRPHFLIAELDLNDTRFIKPIELGGYGMDAQWIDEFHHALRVASGQEPVGYYSDFNGLDHLAKAFRDAYVYDGGYSEHRKKYFGVPAENCSGEQFVIFSQNHDQVGNRMLGERTSTLLGPAKQRLLAGAVIISPYIPLLFMGEEYAEPNPFQYFIDHGDVELVQAVREGRAREFKDFHRGSPPDPFGIETFMNSKMQWELLSKTKHQQMRNYYQRLIKIRKQQEVLSRLDRHAVEVELHAQGKVLVITRRLKDKIAISILNFSNETQQLNLPDEAPAWYKLIASSDTEWGGWKTLPEMVPDRLSFALPAESFSLYTNTI